MMGSGATTHTVGNTGNSILGTTSTSSRTARPVEKMHNVNQLSVCAHHQRRHG